MNKNLDHKLRKKLEAQEQKSQLKKIREKNENKYVTAAIMFLGTLIPLYLMFFLINILFMFFFGAALNLLGVSMAWISPLFHVVIWVAAVISVYRKRSVLDDIIERF